MWLSDGDVFPWGLRPPVPVRGKELEVPDHLANDLKPYKLLQIKSLVGLWRCYLPKALKAQYSIGGVIAELPVISFEAPGQRIDKLLNALQI